MNKTLKYVLGCMLFFSFYTHTIDLDSKNLIVSRMTFSDLFGGLAILIYFFNWFFRIKKNIQIPKLYIFAVITVFSFLLGIVASYSPRSTLFEVVILFYLILLSFVMYESFKNDLSGFLNILIFTSFVMSFIGLYDLFAVNNNWPPVFNSAYKSHAVSGFRYFAQTGNYSFTMLSILLPFRYYTDSKLNWNFQVRLFFNISMILTVLLMVGSGAVSIIISFVFAILLLLVMNFNHKKVRKDILYFISILICFFMSIYFFAGQLFENIVYRFQSRVINRQEGEPEATFIVENFKDALRAFSDNYIFGTGLGGFVNNYSEFEIHGTYLKFIGETGIVGAAGYVLFFIGLTRLIFGLEKEYLKYFMAFFIANILSWSYNYHFRKKEFWILVAFLLIVEFNSSSKIQNEKK